MAALPQLPTGNWNIVPGHAGKDSSYRGVTGVSGTLIRISDAGAVGARVWWRPVGNLGTVRLTEFWQRMDEQFGSVYAQSVAKDFVLARLGGRTAQQALADGEDVKVIWQAICAAFPVPERLR